MPLRTANESATKKKQLWENIDEKNTTVETIELLSNCWNNYARLL